MTWTLLPFAIPEFRRTVTHADTHTILKISRTGGHDAYVSLTLNMFIEATCTRKKLIYNLHMETSKKHKAHLQRLHFTCDDVFHIFLIDGKEIKWWRWKAMTLPFLYSILKHGTTILAMISETYILPAVLIPCIKDDVYSLCWLLLYTGAQGRKTKSSWNIITQAIKKDSQNMDG